MPILALMMLAALPPLPATPKRPVVDTYFGVKVSDDFRWLEKSDDPEVQAWSEAQNARARAYLDALPGREALTRRLGELIRFESPAYFDLEERGGTIFALKFQPPRQQPLVVVLPSLDEVSRERVLLDPVALDESGGTSMDFFQPSLDGKYLAVSLSKGGSERGDVHVFETATGKELAGEVVPAVNTGTAGGNVAWTADGFFYTRHPLEGERPKEDLNFFQQVYFHKLGTPTKADTYALGKGFLRIAENFLKTSEDGKWAADLVQKGDGGEFELYLLPPGGKWTKVASYEDRVVQAQFGLDGAMYLLSKKGAPRGQVLRLALSSPTLDKATVVVAQGEATVESYRATATRLYVEEQLGGPSRVRMLDLGGKDLGLVPTPEVTGAGGLVRLGRDDLALLVNGFLTPPAWFRYQAKKAKLVPTALAMKVPVDLSGYEVLRQTCVSKDGTRVPLSIVRAKSVKLDGKNPTWLTGYGGFDLSMGPGYRKALPAWLELGGVWVQANLRGGGEFGEAWHQGGMLERKQNVFDDFLACARHLIDTKVTSPKRLLIEGGSNGGLLMGAALTQHPKGFKAVVAEVGYFDMLRYETAPNGVFNTTEYGSVKEEGQFKALHGYSPFHRVKNGVQYPAVLMMTGANDPRVEPFHSRKMTARLQASGSKQPVLLRTSSKTGHGMGTPLSERIAQAVDQYAFMCAQLGVKVKEAGGPAAVPPPAAHP
ncbi:MAG: prolyl oligopeptidase family serine peptidase [Myxococcaceae bacterium]